MPVLEKIDLLKFNKAWRPFKRDMSVIWKAVKGPIKRHEITKAIQEGLFISPATPYKIMNGWDGEPKAHHLRRIAWLVKNFQPGHPIEVDFSFVGEEPELVITFIDGNHRLLAASYLQLPSIECQSSGDQMAIEMFTYRSENTSSHFEFT